MKNFKNFDEWINEDSGKEFKHEETPESIKLMGKEFTSEQEIIDAIKLIGFVQLSTNKSRSAEYIFYDPVTRDKWISYDTGYVRFNSPVHKSRWGTGDVQTKTPIHKNIIETQKDRLLFILRRAMKIKGLYHKWKKSGMNMKDFLHRSRGFLRGTSFDI